MSIQVSDNETEKLDCHVADAPRNDNKINPRPLREREKFLSEQSELRNLGEGYKVLRKYVAFTLAEVLITLGIIGVVAALTLPSVIQNYKEVETVNKVKKFYSIMSQAQQFAIKDNGSLDEWGISDNADSQTAEEFMFYLKPYLKISKDCGTKSGCLAYKSQIKILNNTPWLNYDTDAKCYKFILNDGSYAWLRTSNEGGYCGRLNCAVVWTDINGPKPPNTIGRDVFSFQIQKDKIIPEPADDCNTNSAGWGCSKYILINGNMDYLHKK